MKEAFVLMRIYNPIVGGMDRINEFLDSKWMPRKALSKAIGQRFFERLERAFISLKINNCNIIICDDTPKSDIEKWEKHKTEVEKLLNLHGFATGKNNLYFAETEGGEGSSMAAWRLRRTFLEVTKNISKAFAVLLDQDDELSINAIEKISKKMRPNAIVISQFAIKGETELNIIADEGKVHNDIVKKRNIIPQIYKLSTIGWTKAYSRGAMSIMVKDFEDYFNQAGESIDSFFKKHKAYEDFLDFYMLIHSEVELCPNKYITHWYYKHKDSITASPSIKAFRENRAIMLVTLSRLCSKYEHKLNKNWKELLTAHLNVKISEIEKILEKYRTDAEKMNILMKEFAVHTWRGWFTESFKGELEDVFIQEAIIKWNKNCYIENKENTKNETRDKGGQEIIYDDTKTPMQKLLEKYNKGIKYCKKCIIIVISLLLAYGLLYLIFWACGFFFVNIEIFRKIASSMICFLSIFSELWKNNFIMNFLSISLPVFTTFITVIFQIRNHLEIKADEEYSLKKLYFSEFEDLIRHLKANLKVAIEIRLRLGKKKNKKTPMEIHFENFKWPESSFLFSEKIATLIDKSKVDDFTRLRLNLRNMNNSAQWLKAYCISKDYSSEKIKEMLDWEIWRMMSYYLNFSYMKKHNFNFADWQQLGNYISTPSVKQTLCELFMSIDNPDKRSQLVVYYLNMYNNDREEKRIVIFN